MCVTHRLIALALLSCVAGGACSEDSGDAAVSTDAGSGRDAGPPVDAGPSPSPTLLDVSAKVIGREGRDVLVSLTGTDETRDAVGVAVRALDAGGQPVMAFLVGSSDSAEVAFDAPQLGKRAFNATAQLPDLLATRTVDRLDVALFDQLGNRSESRTVAITPQPEMALGDGCDPLLLSNRCAPGLSCRGSPPVCREGEAPQITRLGYLSTTDGSRILVEGTDPDDNLSQLLVAYRDADGEALSVDLDETGVSSEGFTFDARGRSSGGKFFVRIDNGPALPATVPQLAVTPVDDTLRVGEVKTSVLEPTPLRRAGAACDPHGFDACPEEHACSPGTVGVANTCKALAGLRTGRCSTAPVLDAQNGPFVASGSTVGPGAWDAPPGCVTNGPTGRPEGVVRLRLPNRVDYLTLTTQRPGTDFDTNLYLLPGRCPAASVGSYEWCDDGAGNGATLRLIDVPAGDYLVVVDSYDDVGGHWTLMVTAE